MRSFFSKNYFLILICLILFFVPFFWMNPGEMDLGGDGNRLFYFDPKAYLQYEPLYLFDNTIEGIRTIEPRYFILPYIWLLIGLKSIIPSSYVIIGITNGLKLSLSFLFMYLSIKTILDNSYADKRQNRICIFLASVLGGIFYICAPIIIGNYEKALLSQNQVFLNPLAFYLFLKYFITSKFRYLIIFIFISALIATNFSWAAAPPFFAFYPLALLFLVTYSVFILKKKFVLKQVLLAVVLFFGIHAFHIIPEFYSLFLGHSYTNSRVFNENIVLDQLNYFYGVLPTSKLSANLLSHLDIKQFAVLGFVFPLIILIGFILNKPIRKVYLLTAIFFLATLYLVTANITDYGVLLYEKFFYIPGFSMFRNFVGQWAFVFSFFFALLIGQSLFNMFQRINKNYVTIISTGIGVICIITAWPFISGKLMNIPHPGTNVKIPMKMDASYPKMLEYIRSLPSDGAIMTFPFSDCCYSVIHGTNDGAYVGMSPIQLLAGRKDYNGYIVAAPFSELLNRLAFQKDYESLKRLIGILNIRYIFYNSDLKVYDSTFPGSPYSTMRQFFPSSQNEYRLLIDQLADKKIYKEGVYELYQTDQNYYYPTVSTGSIVQPYDNTVNDWYGKTSSFFLNDHTKDTIYIERENCNSMFDVQSCKNTLNLSETTPTVIARKINPTVYEIEVSDISGPYILVLSETYNPNWKVFEKTNDFSVWESLKSLFIKNEPVTSNHALVNGYANAWLIEPGNATRQDLKIEMVEQRLFHLGGVISVCTTILLVIFGMFWSVRRKII